MRRVAPIPISPSTLASPGAQTVSRAHPAQQARLARKAPKAPKVQLDRKVKLGLRDRKAPLVHKGNKALKGLLDRLDPLDPLALLELMNKGTESLLMATLFLLDCPSKPEMA